MSAHTSNKHFFREMPVIVEFHDVAGVENYSPLPDDWLLIATDVRASTQAIADGKYRAVNMAGACAIAALLNAYPYIDIPYVFGGDGVTIAMPDVGTESVLGLLKYCREAVDKTFGLELAAGCTSVRELRENGKKIRVGKLALSEHANQAIFWGDGVEHVEERIKSEKDTLKDIEAVKADFSGLECRWNNIPSDREEVLSMIIKSTIEDEHESSRVYKECFDRIEQIYGNADDYSPVKEDKMSMTGKPMLLAGEVMIQNYPGRKLKSLFCLLKLYSTQIAGWYLMKNKIRTNATRWGNYKRDFVKNADFRKFSDGLKLVLSGTVKQRDLLSSYLQEQRRLERLVFGMHSSPAAMTTCFVTDYEGKHVHFVDGTEGGYAMAALELKQQMKDLKGVELQTERLRI